MAFFPATHWPPEQRHIHVTARWEKSPAEVDDNACAAAAAEIDCLSDGELARHGVASSAALAAAHRRVCLKAGALE
jgi:hypothetical protein